MFRKTLKIISNIFNILVLISAVVGMLFGIVKYLMIVL